MRSRNSLYYWIISLKLVSTLQFQISVNKEEIFCRTSRTPKSRAFHAHDSVYYIFADGDEVLQGQNGPV